MYVAKEMNHTRPSSPVPSMPHPQQQPPEASAHTWQQHLLKASAHNGKQTSGLCRYHICKLLALSQISHSYLLLNEIIGNRAIFCNEACNATCTIPITIQLTRESGQCVAPEHTSRLNPVPQSNCAHETPLLLLILLLLLRLLGLARPEGT